MNNHLVVIFAYHYPPENVAGAARPFRFAKYLSRLGYTCRIITAAPQSDRTNSNAIYVPDPFLQQSRWSCGWQIERATRKLFLPGELGLRWASHASRVARKLVRAHSTSQVTVFSTFPPLGPHLAAFRLVRRERARWIADFRDPFPDRSWNRQLRFSQERIYQSCERILVHRSDAVIANTDSAYSHWLEKYPGCRRKLHLIWNGFDAEENVQALAIPLRRYKQLSHVGELYSGRNVTPILESIARMIAAGRLAAKNLLIRLIGPVQSGSIPDQQFVDRAVREGWLEVVNKQVPHAEARRIAQTSDGLLLLQPQSAVQVPAKLFDYVRIGRPILAFVQPESAVERLIKKSGVPHRFIYPQSASRTIDTVVASFLELPSTTTRPSPWFQEQFNAEYQAGILNALISSLHETPGTDPSARQVPGYSISSIG
jgi:glycosyltransferase involved in cell wall biosynthesis